MKEIQQDILEQLKRLNFNIERLSMATQIQLNAKQQKELFHKLVETGIKWNQNSIEYSNER